MKMTKSITLLILVFTIAPSILSAASDSSKRIIISEAYIFGGSVTGKSEISGLYDLKTLAPSSQLLKSDFSNFNKYPIAFSGYSSILNFGIGISRLDKPGSGILRIAGSVSGGRNINGYYFNNRSYRIDTLVSQRTGEMTFIDSLVRETYDFSYSSSLVQIDVSLIWRTRNRNKLTLFGGAGITAGAGISTGTNIKHMIISEGRSNVNTYYRTDNNYKSESEFFRNKSQTAAAAYFPFGLDYRLSKKHGFWKHLHIFHESRFRIEYYNIPEINKGILTRYSSSFGIRYNIGANTTNP